MALQKSFMALREIIEGSDNIVFFGGAGVSTESGIPDFRSKDGLYNQKYDYPPEQILSRSFFDTNPSEFYRFYFDKVLHLDVLPNAAHLALARLEQRGKLKAVITQNIDGLHQAAGTQELVELHGSAARNYCIKCGASYDMSYMLEAVNIPRCSRHGCSGIVRPDVVMYEEALDEKVIDRALHFISKADVLIVGGTSLVVYPAAGFLQYFRGSKLVIINKTETSGNTNADLIIHDSIGEVLRSVVD